MTRFRKIVSFLIPYHENIGQMHGFGENSGGNKVAHRQKRKGNHSLFAEKSACGCFIQSCKTWNFFGKCATCKRADCATKDTESE